MQYLRTMGLNNKGAHVINLKQLRKKHGITQTEAAKLLHTKIRSWQYWESGEYTIHPAFLELLLIKLGEGNERNKDINNITD